MYIETKLSGGRVLTVAPDNTHLWMVQKRRDAEEQMWRLEDNGCLRNMAQMLMCLGLDRTVVGGLPTLQFDWGVSFDNSQRWKYQNGYIVNKVSNRISMPIIV